MEFELYHHGVKGMKWGVRKARKAYDVVLDRKRKKNEREYVKGRIDDITNPTGHKGDNYKKSMAAGHKYKNSDAKLAWKQAKNKAKMDPKYKDSDEYRKAKKKNAMAVTSDVLKTIGTAYVTDEMVLGGAGRRAAKEATVQTGRAAVTAYTMARGGYDIKWYDKAGNRVG